MRVQLSPQVSPSHTTISGFKIPSQYNNTLPISLKSATTTKINYQQILDDGKEPTEPFTPNLLPINFCRTPGEYNKLLITNGKKISSQFSEAKTQGVPTVEFLNTPVHRRIHEKQERVKQFYRIKEQQRQKSTASQVGDCNCCCCDTFCKICNDQMHANFDDQPILSHVPKVERVITRVRSERNTKSPQRRTLKIESEESSNLNTNRKLRNQKFKQKSKQKTLKNMYLDQESEQYQRIKPLLQRSIQNQKIIEYNKLINDPTMIAYQKMQRIKQYQLHRRERSANMIQLQSSPKPKQPWNYNIPKQKAVADPYCHHHHEIQGLVFHPKPLKQKQDVHVKCHPTGHHNNKDNEIIRKHYGDIAQAKLKQQRDRKVQQKIKVTNNLRKLQQERRQISKYTVKKKFQPKEQFNLDL